MLFVLLMLRMAGPPVYRINDSVLIRLRDGTLAKRDYNYAKVVHRARAVTGEDSMLAGEGSVAVDETTMLAYDADFAEVASYTPCILSPV